MRLKTIGKAMTALAAVLAMGVTPIAASAANGDAAEPATVSAFTTMELAEQQPLTVTGNGIAKQDAARTLKAVRLARYSAGTHDQTNVLGYDVADAGHAQVVDKALTDAGIDHATDYDATNPMAWVAQNLLDSQTSPYAGKLRDLLTQLAKTGLKDDQSAVTLARDADDNTLTARVDPGIYVIVDTTPTGVASIPMLTGTGIHGLTVLKNGDKTTTLGAVEYKANGTTVTKKIVEGDQRVDENAANIGDTVTYELTTTVPNYTGYDTFQLQLSDTLSTGLDYQKVTGVTVTPRGGEATGLDATLYKATPGQDNHSLTVVFAPDKNNVSNILAHKDAFPVDATITVTYTALLNKDAVVNTKDGNLSNDNTVKVQYSHNPNKTDELGETPGDTVKTFTGRFLIEKHDATGKPLKGARFTVTPKNGTVLLNLVKVGSTDAALGTVYRPAVAGENGAVTEVETPDSGIVTIQGVKGDLTVEETASPFNTPALPSFTLTVTPDKTVDGKKANAVENFTGDVNQLATHGDGRETVTVMNVRNLLEMPKTGASWMLVYAMSALLAGVGAFMLLRSRTTR